MGERNLSGYFILDGETAEELSIKMVNYVRDGYEPLGRPFAVVDSDGTYFYQALLKYRKNERAKYER